LVQRFFFAFPRGWPGIALLLMRVTIGSALLAQGGYYLRQTNPTLAAWAAGSIAILAAGLLLIGFLTPFASGAVVLAGLGIWACVLPVSMPALFDSGAPAIFALTILIAIILLGPGAISLDARLFGRREIVFPPPVSRS
jgi:uncharacterized membrane protein YphA (DoxX/SURF4 family)